MRPLEASGRFGNGGTSHKEDACDTCIDDAILSFMLGILDGTWQASCGSPAMHGQDEPFRVIKHMPCKPSICWPEARCYYPLPLYVLTLN